MTYSKQRLREVTELKRETVRRIQTDIGEIDPSPSRKYIHEFSQEFDTFEEIADPQEVLDSAVDADLIWVGDYHALHTNQLYVAELLKHLASHNDNVALAVEPVFAKNQQILDIYQGMLANGLVPQTQVRRQRAEINGLSRELLELERASHPGTDPQRARQSDEPRDPR